ADSHVSPREEINRTSQCRQWISSFRSTGRQESTNILPIVRFHRRWLGRISPQVNLSHPGGSTNPAPVPRAHTPQHVRWSGKALNGRPAVPRPTLRVKTKTKGDRGGHGEPPGHDDIDHRAGENEKAEFAGPSAHGVIVRGGTARGLRIQSGKRSTRAR